MNWSLRYASAKKPIDLRWGVIHEPLPESVYGDVASVMRDSNFYPDPDALKQALAKKEGLPKEMIEVTAGADFALLMLGIMYGKDTHIFTPTYKGYTDIKKFGHKVTEHNALDGTSYSIDTGKIAGASLIYLANPNNPFGTTTKNKVMELVKNNPQAKIVVDETYTDLHDAETVVSEVPKHNNLIVVKSFSKGYGMAGFRVGYFIANKDIVEKLDVDAVYFSTTKVSQAVALAALKEKEHFQELRHRVNAERDLNEQYFRDKGIEVMPSKINCILLRFKTPKEATSFVDKCKQHNILIEQGNCDTNVGLSDRYTRIAVGSAKEMKKLREVL
jgi:histidinol-phosphate aminotransferase